MPHPKIAYQTEHFFSKQFFDLMLSSENDKIMALWADDSLVFTFYVTFSNNIPNWTTFVKEISWLDAYFRKSWNECCESNWQLNYHFYVTFKNSLPNWAIFVERFFD